MSTYKFITDADFNYAISKITSLLGNKADSSHTHTKSQITDFPTSLKNPNSLKIQFNGSDNATYDGSAAKTVNITPYDIGAANRVHSHAYLPLAGGTLTGYLHIKPSSGNGAIELYGSTPFIDFHYNNDEADYTVRLICQSAHTLNCTGDFVVGNSITTKTIEVAAGVSTLNGGVQVYNGLTVNTGEAKFMGATVHPWAVSNKNSNTGNVHMTTQGYLRLGVASSRRYKHDISEIKEESLDPMKLLDLPVVQYKYNDGYLSEDDIRYDKFIPGFVAEDVAEIYPIAADYEEDGQVNDWNARMIVPAQMALIQKLFNKLNEQDTIISKLLNRVDELEKK